MRIVPLNSPGRCCFTPSLQMREMRLREGKYFAQGHTASEYVPQGGLLSIPRMTTVFVGSFLSLVPMQEGMVSALPGLP